MALRETAGYIGAIDQGTTSTRFMVFGKGGERIASAQKEHAQIYPRPGWVEHDPAEIWQRTREVIEECLRVGGLQARDIACLGITNQRETTLVWNRHTGKPVYNAIVWQDTRVSDQVTRLSRDGGQDRFRARTGLPLTTYFSGLKLAWILRECDGARAAADRGDLLFGNVDTFLLWNLTGGPEGGIHATDVTNASRTQLMNLETLQWEEEILAAFDIPRSILPEIRSSSEPYGAVVGTSLNGVPITGILGDQQAALVGQACFAPGQVKTTYGTGCFILMNTGPLKHSTTGLLTTVAYKFGSQAPVYALEGSVAIAGALVQWLRDNFAMFSRSEEIEALASSVDDNGDVYIVPAFSGLYAPYWENSARGVIVGLTRYAGRGHLARAALEATAFQVRDVTSAMVADAQIPMAQFRTDGGMVGNELLLQFQADILDREVVRPKMRETTALGAAYAAGLACGYFSGIEELTQNWQIDKTWKPTMNAPERDRLYGKWKKAVTRSFGWVDE